MSFIASSDGGLSTFPANRTYSAISVAAGIASKDAAVAYDENEAIINIWNQSRVAVPSRNVVIIPRRIELTFMAENTTASDFFIDFYRDTISRWSSGGTQLSPWNTANDEASDFASPVSVAQVYVGELALANAGSDEKVLWRAQAKYAEGNVEEKIHIIFGNDGVPHDEPAQGATVDSVIYAPAIWLGRNQNLSIHGYGTSQAADPKFQYQIWYEEYDAA